MIDQVSCLLTAKGWKHVTIIDDAYDVTPSLDDVPEDKWNTFFDDLSEEQRQILLDHYPNHASYPGPVDLGRAPGFVETVWELRDEIDQSLFSLLFDEFQADRGDKRKELASLENLLKRLDLEVSTKGKRNALAGDTAPIVFLDLFIGPVDTEEAFHLSAHLIEQLVKKTKATPPIVILMSTSPRIDKLGPELRDKADLLGCLFRKIKKSQLSDEGILLEKVYDLLISYDDAIKLQSFHALWRDTLTRSADTFLKSIRKLDLPDYANVHSLVVNPEGNAIGEYMLDLFHTYLHFILEGDADLIAAGKSLNEIDWEQYPPPHFSPSAEAIEILEGTIFHNSKRIDAKVAGKDSDILFHLGDVILRSVKKPSDKQDKPLSVDQAKEEAENDEDILVVLSQSCDLLRKETDALLFMRGVPKPYSLKAHKKPSKDVTPILTIDGEKYTLEWNPKLPETWKLEDALKKVSPDGGSRVVGRFRQQYALQLQQSFLSTAGRVGVPSPLPGYYPVGANIYYKDVAGNPILMKSFGRYQDLIVCLAGRDEMNIVTKIIFDREFIEYFRVELNKIDSQLLHNTCVDKIVAVREDINFYRALRHPLNFSRSRNERPFAGNAQFDVIHFFCKTVGPKLDGKDGPIVIEISEEI